MSSWGKEKKNKLSPWNKKNKKSSQFKIGIPLLIFTVLLVYVGFFHEVIHGVVAVLYGNEWYGIYIGLPYSYSVFTGTNLNQPLIYLSGGLADCIIFFSLPIVSDKLWQYKIDLRLQIFLMFLGITRLIYGIYEMIFFMRWF